ncbi:hypothetical protein GLAREA_01433 [Glarea lozoyensis ATCC 20868]|uniref:DUF6594 domain-containing protein n=1 Tax=Glarea lozoyensis (strain ATCC 20868 / MF5171) TaxID=1116229 RepID=S3D0D7_GLAL2|nr:uncharacterized protein GLAREA_01433 [Glarea lozoyensis ATCC 20868]EPE25521.1 hypothetical protein GLAREA_01433 [Glarea lozoyensis ATCC 20868]
MADVTSNERGRLANDRTRAILPTQMPNEALSRSGLHRASRRPGDEESGKAVRSRSRLPSANVSRTGFPDATEPTPANEARIADARQPRFWKRPNFVALFRGLWPRPRNISSVEEINQQKIEIVDEFPNGYPRFAAYLASDVSFMQFRRFRRLSARDILQQQTNLSRLQKELDALDAEYSRDNAKRKILKGWNDGAGSDNEAQANLMKEIKCALVEYRQTVLGVKNMEQLDTTAEEDFHSLYNCLTYQNSLTEASGSRDFLLHPEDFVSLSRKQKDKTFEDLAVWLLDRGPMWFRKIFLQTCERENEKHTSYYDHRRLSHARKLLSCFLVTTIILGPIYILFLYSHWSKGTMVTIFSVFIGLFVSMMFYLTSALAHEVFVGAATYGTVLLIFLSNTMQGGYLISSEGGNATAS